MWKNLREKEFLVRGNVEQKKFRVQHFVQKKYIEEKTERKKGGKNRSGSKKMNSDCQRGGRDRVTCVCLFVSLLNV